MKLQDAVRDYLHYLKHEQRGTAATLRTYQSGLNALLRWFAEQGRPEPTTFDFSTPMLRKYLYFHSERGLRPRTLRGRFHPIKALAAFLIANDALKTDPSQGITLPKKDPAIRQTVSETEVRALLDACERIANVRHRSLASAVLHVLIFSGLRRQECLDLFVTDYHAEEGYVYVGHGKGDKARTVYLPDVARIALDDWLLHRPKSENTYLFLLDTRRRVGQDALRFLVEEVRSIAGLRDAKHITPHVLRHFYASHLLRSGADLESIRVLLGHADLRTTSVYIHADERRLKEVAQLSTLHPQALAVSKPTSQPDKAIRPPQSEDDRPRLRRVSR
jgi:site-specific recombinase XerD